MDWLTFISQIMSQISWPIAVLAIAILFRKEFKTLLPKTRKLKAGPVEAEFESTVMELQEHVLETGAQSATTRSMEYDPARGELHNLVENNPRLAIIKAWQNIEFAARDLLKRSDPKVSAKDSASPLAIIRALTKKELLNTDDIALYHELRALRNEAIHVEDFNPSQESTLNYVELALRLSADLKRAADDNANG